MVCHIVIMAADAAHCAAILHLPVELHDMITEHLSIFDKHALRGSCRYFRVSLPPFITLDAPVTLEKLYEAAYTWDHTRFKLQVDDVIKSRYVCTYCMRLLPRSRFADEAFCLHTRNLFCIRCGVLPMSHDPYSLKGAKPPARADSSQKGGVKKKMFVPYSLGTRMMVEGAPCIICPNCRKLQACSTLHFRTVCDACHAQKIEAARQSGLLCSLKKAAYV